MKRYHVVPFKGVINEKQSANDVSKQLEEVLNYGARNGWTFEHLNSVNIEVRPGCFAWLFGLHRETTKHDMVVFSEELQVP